jgi:hypothetical protein
MVDKMRVTSLSGGKERLAPVRDSSRRKDAQFRRSGDTTSISVAGLKFHEFRPASRTTRQARWRAESNPAWNQLNRGHTPPFDENRFFLVLLLATIDGDRLLLPFSSSALAIGGWPRDRVPRFVQSDGSYTLCDDESGRWYFFGPDAEGVPSELFGVITLYCGKAPLP